MSRRKRKKNSAEKDCYDLILTPKIRTILSISDDQNSTPVTLSQEQALALEEYLANITALFETKKALLKEMKTYHLKKLQLTETKEIVYSLREADETSDEALNFLKEKMIILDTERQQLIQVMLRLQNELQLVTHTEYSEKINEAIASFDFIETEGWENKLDYYRNRFLMQKEQEEDLGRKAKHRPLEAKVTEVYRDPLSKPKKSTPIIINKPTVKIIIPKSFRKKLIPLIKSANKLLNNLTEHADASIFEQTEDELQKQLSNVKADSLITGKELYTLKKEQGILTLKNYEIVQTLKSRLLNISGSIASRSFLGNGFKELIRMASNKQLEGKQKLKEINKIITRLLRILGELKPGEELKGR